MSEVGFPMRTGSTHAVRAAHAAMPYVPANGGVVTDSHVTADRENRAASSHTGAGDGAAVCRLLRAVSCRRAPYEAQLTLPAGGQSEDSTAERSAVRYGIRDGVVDGLQAETRTRSGSARLSSPNAPTPRPGKPLSTSQQLVNVT